MTYFQVLLSQIRAALTGKHDTLVRRAPGWQGALRIHLTRLSTEGLGPRHGEVRRAHQMLNAALSQSLDSIDRIAVVQIRRDCAALAVGEMQAMRLRGRINTDQVTPSAAAAGLGPPALRAVEMCG